MGAILKLRQMPGNCRECPLADKKDHICTVRRIRIIAYESRNFRMTLCPLKNEGKFFTEMRKTVLMMSKRLQHIEKENE